MRTEKGGVMSIREMEEAGIPMPEYEEEEIDTGERKIPVVRQRPASNEGIIEFPKKEEKTKAEQPELPLAA